MFTLPTPNFTTRICECTRQKRQRSKTNRREANSQTSKSLLINNGRWTVQVAKRKRKLICKESQESAVKVISVVGDRRQVCESLFEYVSSYRVEPPCTPISIEHKRVLGEVIWTLLIAFSIIAFHAIKSLQSFKICSLFPFANI